MKSARGVSVVLVTTPDLKTARSIARGVLHDRLAACVNIVPRIESHYWWEDKLTSSSELLLLIKTDRSRLRRLEERVLELHPYETPEFLVVPFEAGTDRYLDWLKAALRGPAGS
jgi:periplasmic divalent cation tolerance protein